MRWLLRLLAVLFPGASGYVGFKVMQIAARSELGSIDLLVGIGTLAAFGIGVWLLLDVGHILD